MRQHAAHVTAPIRAASQPSCGARPSPDPTAREAGPLPGRLAVATSVLRGSSASGQVPQVPAFSGLDELPAPIRASADDATLRDDRLPPTTLPPVLAVVVQEPLLRAATRHLVSEATKPLVARPRFELTAAEVTHARRKHDQRRHTRRPPLLPLRTPLRAVPLIAVMCVERRAARTNLPDQVRITPIFRGEKFSGRGW